MMRPDLAAAAAARSIFWAKVIGVAVAALFTLTIGGWCALSTWN
jgi:hypothetical protein